MGKEVFSGINGKQAWHLITEILSVSVITLATVL